MQLGWSHCTVSREHKMMQLGNYNCKTLEHAYGTAVDFPVNLESFYTLK